MTHDQPIIQYVRLQISFRSPNFECKCICLYHWSGDKIWKLKIDKRPKKTQKKTITCSLDNDINGLGYAVLYTFQNGEGAIFRAKCEVYIGIVSDM